jgi:hypothetical protein
VHQVGFPLHDHIENIPERGRCKFVLRNLASYYGLSIKSLQHLFEKEWLLSVYDNSAFLSVKYHIQ